jgi:excisionase family DNA binding protein
MENNLIELLTIEEAAQLLKIKKSRLRKAIFRREVKYVKLGALIRF